MLIFLQRRCRSSLRIQHLFKKTDVSESNPMLSLPRKNKTRLKGILSVVSNELAVIVVIFLISMPK